MGMAGKRPFFPSWMSSGLAMAYVQIPLPYRRPLIRPLVFVARITLLLAVFFLQCIR